MILEQLLKGRTHDCIEANKEIAITVEPVLSGTILSGHPLLSGQLSKSQKLCPLIIVILTSIKQSPLLK